jgi:hypothetical protein
MEQVCAGIITIYESFGHTIGKMEAKTNLKHQ